MPTTLIFKGDIDVFLVSDGGKHSNQTTSDDCLYICMKNFKQYILIIRSRNEKFPQNSENVEDLIGAFYSHWGKQILYVYWEKSFFTPTEKKHLNAHREKNIWTPTDKKQCFDAHWEKKGFVRPLGKKVFDAKSEKRLCTPTEKVFDVHWEKRFCTPTEKTLYAIRCFQIFHYPLLKAFFLFFFC